MSAQQLITEHIDLWTSTIKARKTQGRGSNKKRELYGIKKLRELILELAVRGKLVEQDPTDEPASVLLERIAKEKAQLVKDKKIKKPKRLPEITNEEKPFDLPKGWEWTQLGQISEIAPRNSLDDDLEVGFVPMPMISTSYKGDHEQKVKLWSEIKKGYTHFANGDIGLAKITPCFENSKAAVFKNLKNGFGAGTTELHIARPIVGTINILFVLLYLKAPMFLEKGKPKMTGSAGQKRIPNDFFSGNPLPFPPLEEQHRIVAKVDELMALCDQLKQQTESSLSAHNLLVDTLLATLTNARDAKELSDSWARFMSTDGLTTENAGAISSSQSVFDTLITTDYAVEQLKQTILQLAVMGKLVPQNPNDEPASELLKRIATEKAQLVKDKKIKKQKPLPGIGDDEKPFEIPAGWKWCHLPDIGDLARGKSKHRPRNDPSLYSGGNIPLVQTGDVSRANGVIDTYTALYNEAGLAQSQLWPKGTMCITIAANIADTSILGFDACFPDSVVGYTPFDDEINVKYFEFFIRTAKNHLEEYAPSTAQKNINLEILSHLLVPCPPFNEISRIVFKVDELMTLCEQLKSQLNNAQTTQLHLSDAVVENALTA